MPDPRELHPPSGNPALHALLPTATLRLGDGSLIVGVADGTITGLDGAGHRRWSLGLRGWIRGLTSVGRDAFVVTTEAGVVARMASSGQLLWSRQVTDDRLTPAVLGPGGLVLVAAARGVYGIGPSGDLVFSHVAPVRRVAYGDADDRKLAVDPTGVVSVSGISFRLSDPHPPIPSLEPVFPLSYRRVSDGNVVSLAAAGLSEIVALVSMGADGFELVRVSGDRVTRSPVPTRAPRAEVVLAGRKPERAQLWVDALVEGPAGDPWLLGGRKSSAEEDQDNRFTSRGAGLVFEVSGGKLRERKDLAAMFATHPVTSSDGVHGARGGRLLCFSESAPICAASDGSRVRMLTPPGPVAVVGRVGDASWLATKEGELARSDGVSITSVPRPNASGSRVKAVAGSSDHDVWVVTDADTSVTHFDGSIWIDVPTPVPIEGIVVRTADDAWSEDGRARWDGKRWSTVASVRGARRLVARGRDDVWVGGSSGLWHGTAPAPAVVRLAALAAEGDGVAAMPTALPFGERDGRFTVERARFEVKNGEPVTTAKRLAVAPDGTLWASTGGRLVEVDKDGNATIHRRDERTSFARWFLPEAAGRGIVLDDPIAGPDDRATISDLSLQDQRLVAIDAAGGVTWVVGAHDNIAYSRVPSGELLGHALVRVGQGAFAPVLGLPSAAWCDVAASSDGGAWFVGALNAGPMGEGILFRARGAGGTGGTLRARAPATLFAVAAVGPEEAWAVGAAGAMVHVEGTRVTRFELPSRAWLRAVAGAKPDDVWFGGDDGTLLHFDGRELHAVDHPLGAHASVTGLASLRGSVWAVGPSGILRIARRP
jgi:hypothetical protein